MEFRLLGPLELVEGDRPVRVGGARQRALLALLLIRANELVSSDWLIEELWREHPPVEAANALQAAMSRLRRTLNDSRRADGPGVQIRTHAPGYVLDASPELIDSRRFERLASEGREALSGGDSGRASTLLREALALWRGTAFADFVYEPFAQAEIARLEELRLTATEDRIDADLNLGREPEVIAELQDLAACHPFRERLQGQLMLALYRSGRQVDALRAYRERRTFLIEELGVEPGAHLRELERAILAQDAALALPVGEARASAASAPVASRLPGALTRLIGRHEDRDAVERLLRRGDVRLVSLTGAGGVGKTRLALEVARDLEPRLRDGAWLIPLAGTSDARQVPAAIAQELGVTLLGGETSQAAIKRFLAAKEGLLLLDNLEHLLSAAPLLTDLLAACPAMRVLATTREPLRVQAEHCYEVAPLQLPAASEPRAVERAAATALFIERACSHDSTFELSPANASVIAQICRRLDGLPLAIELAAARASLLGANELNARLAHALDILGRGSRDAPDRQRTLRATIDWSHRLLSPPEADAFAGFAVFVGGAAVEAAQEVTGADIDTLQGLVDKRLLLSRGGWRQEARLMMLETVRDYAREKLEADARANKIHERHFGHYLALAEQAEPHLYAHGEAEWMARLDAEVDNLRAALDGALERAPVRALRLAGLLGTYWVIRRNFDEALSRLDAVLAAGANAPMADRARARLAQSRLLEAQGGSPAEARKCGVEALGLYRELDDSRGIVESLCCLSAIEHADHRIEESRALGAEAILNARRADDERLLATALQHNMSPSPKEYAETARLLRKVGNRRYLTYHYTNAAYRHIVDGRYDVAEKLLAEALPLARETRDPFGLLITFGNRGLVSLFTGDLEKARSQFGQQLRTCREHALPFAAEEGLAGLAAVAARDDPERAALLCGAASVLGPIDEPAIKARLEEQFFTPARERSGEQRWTDAWSAGAALSLQDALDTALRPVVVAMADTG